MKLWPLALPYALLVVFFVWGVSLANPFQAAEVCGYDVVDFQTCEGAKDRSALFGSLLVAASIIAISVIGAAALRKKTIAQNETHPTT